MTTLSASDLVLNAHEHERDVHERPRDVLASLKTSYPMTVDLVLALRCPPHSPRTLDASNARTTRSA